MDRKRQEAIQSRGVALSKALVDGDFEALRHAMPDRATDREWAHVLAMAGLITGAAVIKGTGGTMRSALDLLRGAWDVVKIELVDKAKPS